MAARTATMIACRVRLVVAGTSISISGLYRSTVDAVIAALEQHPAATRVSAQAIGGRP